MKCIKSLQKIPQEFFFAFKNFFSENPFLTFSLIFLLGTFIKFQKCYFLFFIPLILKTPKKIIFIIIILTSFLYSYIRYPSFPNIKTKKAKAIFVINDIFSSSQYKKGFLYKGKLSKFNLDGKIYKNIPCIIFLKKRISANFSYEIEGYFSNITPYKLIGKNISFQKNKKINSLLEFRLKTKKMISEKIKKNIKNQKAAFFLEAIITGRLKDRFLRFAFKRVGIQHILAISGFHFGIIMLSFYFILRKFIHYGILPYILLLIINLYFLYIGTTPSILRAYITIQIALIAEIFNKKNIALNTFGIALFSVLFIDPIYIKDLGFQFSFISVGSILLTYPFFSSFLGKCFLKRKIKELSFFQKIEAFISNFLKESLSIILCVNLAIFPLLLYHFHKIPLLSILYNLFIPFLLLISILIFFLSQTFFFFPILKVYINIICGKYTNFILHMILYPPLKLEFFIRTNKISFQFAVLYLILYFSLFITLKYRKKMYILPKPLEWI